MKLLRALICATPRRVLATMSVVFTFGACQMDTQDPRSLPSRYQNLPLFNPHISTFNCEIEVSKVPPIDAQADVWFHEALALDSADIFPPRRDYKAIVQLTRQAAERRHWKAMLNLASLYLAGHDPNRGEEDAVRLVEEAMRLGIPAAYDRMGTYYMNGTGVNVDVTLAYAFWQRAAEMGSPEAMAFLGKKLNAVWDDPQGNFWNNKAVGIKMLECAYGQGNGDAAFLLGQSYQSPADRNATREDKARALLVFHQGVKYGSELSANRLRIEFSRPQNLEQMIAPYIDPDRAERYRVLSEALSFDPSDRFPNLDKVLPLPPARLPPWNGDRDTLLNAARGVRPPSAPPKPSATSQRSGRYYLDAEFALRDTGHETRDLIAPVEGYWQPVGMVQEAEDRAEVEQVPPGLYRRGEEFPRFMSKRGPGRISDVVWRRWDTIRHDPHAVEPLAPANRVRTVTRPQPLISCAPESSCPVRGTWQPWVHTDHPQSSAVNQYWRQAWLVEGDSFPHPERDWLLPISVTDVSWHLMDAEDVSLL
jgi:hypothetical protein